MSKKKLEKLDINNIETISESAYIDPAIIEQEAMVASDEVIEQKPAIQIGWHPYKEQQVPAVFGSYGDFSCIVGASKSMKSKLKIGLVPSYIGGKSQYWWPDFHGINASGKYILDLDTEQSRYHVKRMRNDVEKLTGIEDYEFYKTFNLRSYHPSERLAFLEWLAFESPYTGNIGLICVDGAADLIDDTNDLVQSQRLTNLFMKITEQQDCHLITVLHRTKASNKPTGHIGSSILKKAETVVFVDKDEDGVVTVTPEYTRNRAFDKFTFKLNNDWIPVTTDAEEEQEEWWSQVKD